MLYHVRDLVCQQPQALGCVRRERLPAEEDVRADGQRGGPERAADLIDAAVVQPDRGELDSAPAGQIARLEQIRERGRGASTA
jgi:hypothetical protein